MPKRIGPEVEREVRRLAAKGHGLRPDPRLLAELIARHAGPAAVSLFDSFWRYGDLDELLALFESSGLEVAATRTRRFRVLCSIEEFVTTEAERRPSSSGSTGVPTAEYLRKPRRRAPVPHRCRRRGGTDRRSPRDSTAELGRNARKFASRSSATHG